MKTISIIIPCHNEEENIEKLYKELEIVRNNLTYDLEYIFINDGSKDETTKEIKDISCDKRVKMIDFSKNFGKEAAIMAGLDASVKDAAIVIDADLQMPVKYIYDLIEEWENGFKLVLTYKESRRKGLKSFLARKYYTVYNNITNGDILPDALDFQLMDREVIDTICSFREKNRFFKGLTGLIGYDFTAIPIVIEKRTAGESDFSNYKQLFSYAISSLVPHSTVPLVISTYIGFFTAIFGLLFMLYTIITTYIGGTAGSGYATVISLILLFFGLILIILGVIGYYIGMIYEEVKNRPIYIVKQTINFEDK